MNNTDSEPSLSELDAEIRTCVAEIEAALAAVKQVEEMESLIRLTE